MTMVTYKIRVNRPCRLFIDDEEIAILEELKLAKFDLPEGEYLRKVVAIDNTSIYDEAVIVLSGASKLENITLDTIGLDEQQSIAFPVEGVQIGDLLYKYYLDGSGVYVEKCVNSDATSINIPSQINFAYRLYDVVKIGEKAFWYCNSLRSISIPNGIQSIEEYAFYHCKNLNSVTIPNSVTYIGKYAFADCVRLGLVCINEGVKTIEECAFENTRLNSISLPDSLLFIGKEAFHGCLFESIFIPKNVSQIRTNAFPGSAKSIQVDVENQFYDSRNNCNAIIKTSTNALIKGGDNTIIPSSVTSIYPFAFADCSFEEINIPNGVKSIDAYAFFQCYSLKKVHLPMTIEEFGPCIFFSCWDLTEIELPEGITNISDHVFYGSSLLSVKIPSTVKTIGEGAFKCCDLIDITLPASVESIGKEAFTIKDGQRKFVYIPAGTYHKFKKMEGIKEIINDIYLTELIPV